MLYNPWVRRARTKLLGVSQVKGNCSTPGCRRARVWWCWWAWAWALIMGRGEDEGPNQQTNIIMFIIIIIIAPQQLNWWPAIRVSIPHISVMPPTPRFQCICGTEKIHNPRQKLKEQPKQQKQQQQQQKGNAKLQKREHKLPLCQ